MVRSPFAGWVGRGFFRCQRGLSARRSLPAPQGLAAVQRDSTSLEVRLDLHGPVSVRWLGSWSFFDASAGSPRVGPQRPRTVSQRFSAIPPALRFVLIFMV